MILYYFPIKYMLFYILASVDLHFKEHIQNVLLSILKKLLIVGSLAPPHFVFSIILRFRTNIRHFYQAFW